MSSLVCVQEQLSGERDVLIACAWGKVWRRYLWWKLLPSLGSLHDILNSSSPTSPKSSLHTQGEHSLPAEMFLNSNQAGQLLVFVIVWPPSYSTWHCSNDLYWRKECSILTKQLIAWHTVEPAKQGHNRLVCSYVEGVASYQIFTVCYHTAAKHVNVSAMSNLADEREIKHDATFP